ncbi:MAG: STAS domain-containing protein [Calditrichaeota bacterium]|nr:STAS domain-containing protein [Calditrichota bacterium]MCB0291912.1 STAS domain-containing protein [Calditrichota bacterium]MCB0302892.1 STAS domain-containing protein [Calditrichota bacterium]MCB0314318.1 STAS domain-containing protein [Calditrichota bacterium]MCB9088026.1 STAS domain-containing protein [Calditrichia bacterium]
MYIRYQQQKQTIYILITGEIRNEHNRDLRATFAKVLERDFRDVIIDLAQVPFIQTHALGSFVEFIESLLLNSKYICLTMVNDLVYNLFELVGLDERVWIDRRPRNYSPENISGEM